MQHKKDKQRSNAVRYTTTAVAILLMCALCFTFLIFATDTIINVNTDEANRADNLFGRVSVSTVIETVEEESYGDGDNNDEIVDENPNPGSQVTPPMQTHEWYTPITETNVPFSNVVIDTFTMSSGESFYVYKGIPFSQSLNSDLLYFNLGTARRDTEEWWGADEVTVNGWHRMYNKDKQQYRYYSEHGKAVEDASFGIKCFSVNVAPCFVSSTYCDNFKDDARWITDPHAGDEFYGQDFASGHRYAKHPIVLQVEDKSDGTIGYIALEPFPKAHTWPGGVYQTHVTIGEHSVLSNTPTTFQVDTGDYVQGWEAHPKTTIKATAWADYKTWCFKDNPADPCLSHLSVSVEPAYAPDEDIAMLNKKYRVLGAILWRE